MRRRLIVQQFPLLSPTYWRQKNTTPFLKFYFTRQLPFFSVVAPNIFIDSGTYPSNSIITLYIKAQMVSAINMKAVPSFSISQEISEFAMGGLELCPNA
ncbi:hypothetical protein RHM58_13890 [Pseudomonas sp. 10S4]|uniref:hypothetical protein n=1 Tax=Pseudomonas sp. 10S4 TaxID=3048583 RepID=UPI002AC8C656|nr:hypothetical protein [Pseudomonas sp. 10S4]WPX20860.1 hypothetical protein RHM58_13890 [Pseudomonas sp. 10S4]